MANRLTTTPTNRPSVGQCRLNETTRPTITIRVGASISSSASEAASKPHMARETRRTVAPAKFEPCQSVEKDCTRLNPSPTMRAMMRL